MRGLRGRAASLLLIAAAGCWLATSTRPVVTYAQNSNRALVTTEAPPGVLRVQDWTWREFGKASAVGGVSGAAGGAAACLLGTPSVAAGAAAGFLGGAVAGAASYIANWAFGGHSLARTLPPPTALDGR